MASNDALWSEVCRVLNRDFFQAGQPITPVLLVQLIKAINEMLTEDNPSA